MREWTWFDEVRLRIGLALRNAWYCLTHGDDDGRCYATIRTVSGEMRCDRPRGDHHGLMHVGPDGFTRWPE